MSLFRSGIIVAILTLISRILGLIREFFIAYTFGTSLTADAVNTAFKLPNLFRRIFGEGAFSLVFIPIFNQKLQKSEQLAKDFSGKMFAFLLTSLVIIVVIFQLLMPQIMWLIAPGFIADEQKYNLTILLCRITMPYLIFISLVSLYGGILNSLNNFHAFALTPIIMNIILIIGTILLQNFISPASSISIALLLAGLLQLIFIVFSIKKHNMLFSFRFNFWDNDTKIMCKQLIPAIFNAGIVQLNLFISHSISSFIPGAISILSYAERIYQLPLSIIGISFSTVLLPKLSKIYSTKNEQDNQSSQLAANDTINQAIKISIFLSIPATLGILTLAYPIIHILYERGAFTPSDTLLTAQALMAFSLGLPAFIMIKIITPLFYATNDTITPFRMNIYALTINTVLNIILMIFIKHIGIALGSSIAAWINLMLLYHSAKKRNLLIINNDIKYFIFQIFILSAIMSTVIMIMRSFVNDLLFYAIWPIKIFAILLTISAAIITYFVGAMLCQVLSLKKMLSLIKK